MSSVRMIIAAALIPRRLPTGEKVYPSMSQFPGAFTVRRHALEDDVPTEPVPYDPTLNDTERQVLYWMSVGKRYEEMSELLGMSTNALYQHCHRIYNKLGANNAAGAVGIGLRKGFIK